MNWDNYKGFLLQNIPGAKLVSGGKQINCRCRECPDSRDPQSRHFYISIPRKENEPSLYYCHKCNCKGIVTHEKLNQWGLYDQGIAIELTEYNKTVDTTSIKKYKTSFLRYQISSTYTTIDAKSELKRQYLVKRLGYELNFAEIRDLKIILNLKDLLSENCISNLTRHISIINELDREFIGFLSIDNSFLNMRRTCGPGIVYESIDKRYVNYNIMNNQDTSQKFYTIPMMLNINTPERIKLHIAEGPMDILSIYLNLRKKEPGIYTALTGNNYMNIIYYFLALLKIPNLEIHLYPDNDKYGTINRMEWISKQLIDKTLPVYVHKNSKEGEKDFGVSLDRIVESVIRIV